MECNKPIKAWKPIDIDNPDRRIKFNIRPEERKEYEEITIPCGKCTACKINKANEWGIRCSLETKKWKHSYFITLTYDNEHLFFTEDQKKWPSISKQELQKFIKRLRKHYSIRYFACGEYGGKTKRPHYHMIIWTDTPINDLKGVNKLISVESSKYLTSEEITQIWGKGGVTIAYNNYNTACYVAKYTLKSQNEEDDYEGYGLNKPFIIMSRKPVIGSNYLERDEEEQKLDSIMITYSNQMNEHKSKRTKIPRAYLKKMSEDIVEEIKGNREQKGINYQREKIRVNEIKCNDYILEQKEQMLIENINRNKI